LAVKLKFKNENTVDSLGVKIFADVMRNNTNFFQIKYKHLRMYLRITPLSRDKNVGFCFA